MAPDALSEATTQDTGTGRAVRLRNRYLCNGLVEVATLALIRDGRQGKKSPRRTREMPKTGVTPAPDPFSDLFNVAASRSAQITTRRELRTTNEEVKRFHVHGPFECTEGMTDV
jgi:hypothetical protein